MKRKIKILLFIILAVFIAVLMTRAEYSHHKGDTSQHKDISKEESSFVEDFLYEDDDNYTNYSQSNKGVISISDNDPNITIEDNNFIASLDEIITNLNNYLGKTIKIEGILKEIEEGKYSVIRLYDMEHEDHTDEIYVGININYDGKMSDTDTWVEVIGTIEKLPNEVSDYPVINVSSLIEKSTYGQEKVIN